MQLKSLRPLTALTSFPTPPSPPPRHPAIRPFVSPRFNSSQPRRPRDDDQEPLPPPLISPQPPRTDGSKAPMLHTTRHHRSHHRPPPKPAPIGVTAQLLKILGAVTALVGAYHAAPAVHERLHKHRHRDERPREDIVIELADLSALNETGLRRPDE